MAELVAKIGLRKIDRTMMCFDSQYTRRQLRFSFIRKFTNAFTDDFFTVVITLKNSHKEYCFHHMTKQPEWTLMTPVS